MSFRFSLEQIDQAVNYLDENLNTPVICFDGPMGAGKTTLISELCKKWQVTDPISSPTFSLSIITLAQVREGFITLIFTDLKT